jgi:hypothetical protein
VQFRSFAYQVHTISVRMALHIVASVPILHVRHNNEGFFIENVGAKKFCPNGVSMVVLYQKLQKLPHEECAGAVVLTRPV